MNNLRNCLRNLLFTNHTTKLLGGNGGSSNRIETVVIDYSSPNIAKPFHLGHFRAAVTGNFVKNINEAFGHKVIGINYIGDWGTQFDILASGFSKYGDEDELQRNPIEHLYKIYVQANRDIQLLNDRKPLDRIGNENEPVSSAESIVNHITEIQSRDTEFWRRVRQITCEQLTSNYKRMNIQFTTFEYESDYVEKAYSIASKLLANGLAYKSSDIAAAISRYEKYHFDRIHYVVEVGQRLHFQQLNYILLKLGYNWPVLSMIGANDDKSDNDQPNKCARNLLHVPFGRVIGVSTRKGEGLFLRNILDNAQQFMLNRMKSSQNTRITQNESTNASLSRGEIADHLGVTCLVTTMFTNPRQKPINLQTFLGLPVMPPSNSQLLKSSPNGSELNGLSLQYCHARLCSLESRSISTGLFEFNVCSDGTSKMYDVNHLIHEYDQFIEWPSTTINEKCFMKLADQLYRFSTVLHIAYSKYEPYYILQYALQLTSAVNSAWKHLPILTCPNREDQLLRLYIFIASRNVLASCLRLMGIKPLKAM
ncbi:putative arginine--tRNA ligase, mitochondrial [Schistosoma japonicum]|nr:putative arginine--tRNA ligase, mitochondrial [Schistosoma japonicum]KAH8858188.1 putative arginine--tRNA ligase, mitochondrial [Schistosoma japonicum]KAH8858189.1 putative arginine--tRNA ligase, mitochondrial [Schistosoma japonicum]KAH8858190.1 putative arginine--tRNA ligase, mitochondrial [Schistosoma japonicum]